MHSNFLMRVFDGENLKCFSAGLHHCCYESSTSSKKSRVGRLEEDREEGGALSRVEDVYGELVFKGCWFFGPALGTIIISHRSQEVITIVLVSSHIY
jgi:hypothetical protein